VPDPSRRTPQAASTTIALAVSAAVLLAGCAQVVLGRATAAPATAALATPLTHDRTTAAPADAVAEATANALQALWRTAFPAVFGREWNDIDEFAAVHTRDPAAAPPPCVNRASDLADQAFYCPAADTVAWDADGLLPGLHERFGPAGVVVVLAHEVGHAVQSRLGLDQAQQREPHRFPTILLEVMSDCYAGVAFAQFVERPVAGVPVDIADRDDALRALVGFRDPLGLAAGDEAAHGNAFDRVSAFQDGFRGGPGACADMSLDNRPFTQRQFGSAADFARGGNLALPELLRAVETDARDWFAQVEPGWQPPWLGTGGACPGAALTPQGPTAFCPADGGVAVDLAALDVLHGAIGDFASGTLVVARYGIALLAERGEPTDTPTAGAAATCLTGAYAAGLLDRPSGFRLSPGDLDEVVQVLLADNWAARDTTGTAAAEDGFDRIARFRAGAVSGTAACLP
jgi:predicted metalloprotease